MLMVGCPNQTQLVVGCSNWFIYLYSLYPLLISSSQINLRWIPHRQILLSFVTHRATSASFAKAPRLLDDTVFVDYTSSHRYEFKNQPTINKQAKIKFTTISGIILLHQLLYIIQHVIYSNLLSTLKVSEWFCFSLLMAWLLYCIELDFLHKQSF